MGFLQLASVRHKNEIMIHYVIEQAWPILSGFVEVLAFRP